MKITLVICLLFLSTPLFAVDFSQQDKKGHFLLGCASSEVFRGFASDAGYSNPGLIGLGAGFFVGGFYELLKTNPDSQDFMASAIGSISCISLSESVKLIVERDKIQLRGTF